MLSRRKEIKIRHGGEIENKKTENQIKLLIKVDSEKIDKLSQANRKTKREKDTNY